MVYLGKKTDTVVNIGHGTTEIISITPGNIDGKSVKMDRDVVAAINISCKLPPRFRGRDNTSKAQSGIKPAITEPRTPAIQLDMSKGGQV